MLTKRDQRERRCGQTICGSLQVRPPSLDRHTAGTKSFVAVFAENMNEQIASPPGNTTMRGPMAMSVPRAAAHCWITNPWSTTSHCMHCSTLPDQFRHGPMLADEVLRA